MFDHDPDKARASGFSLDGFDSMREHNYFSSGDGFGSIAPSQLSRMPDDMSRMDSHAMDWTPTPTGHGSHFRNQNTFHDQEDLIDFDDITPAQPQVSGVGRLVAQFENKDYVPPLPPRPIINTASSPAETDPSITNSSFSSYFGSFAGAAHANHATSPVGSPVDSQYGSFGDVLSRITSPQDINSIESSSPLLTFGTFPNARIASPHISAVRSHAVPGLSQFTDERTRTPFGGENKTMPNPDSMDTDSGMFGDVERNILTFLKSELDGGNRLQSLQPMPQEPHQMQHVTPQATQQTNFATAQQVHQQLNRQLSNRIQPSTSQAAQSTQPNHPFQQAKPPPFSQPIQPAQPTRPTQPAQPSPPAQASRPIEPGQQVTRQPSTQSSHQSTQQPKTPFQSFFSGSTTSGTPGFSIWRPPSSPEIKEEPTADSPAILSKSLFEKPPIPPKPKPIQEQPQQITLDFSSSIKGKGKAPVKPPKPPKPPRSKLQPPAPPPRPLDTSDLSAGPSNEQVPQTPATPATPATPSTTADVTSPGPSVRNLDKSPPESLLTCEKDLETGGICASRARSASRQRISPGGDLGTAQTDYSLTLLGRSQTFEGCHGHYGGKVQLSSHVSRFQEL